MTDIDPQADIEIYPTDDYMTVRVPVAGPVNGQWLRSYQKLALAAEVPVQAEAHHDRTWIVVRLPSSSDQGQVVATLDAAWALIAEADAAERPSTAEATVRDWWGRPAGKRSRQARR
jgi:hypothetical protein